MSKIVSGKTFAFVLAGEVPPGLTPAQIGPALSAGVAVSLQLSAFVKAVTVVLSDEDPAALVQRLGNVQAGPKIVQ